MNTKYRLIFRGNYKCIEYFMSVLINILSFVGVTFIGLSFSF